MEKLAVQNYLHCNWLLELVELVGSDDIHLGRVETKGDGVSFHFHLAQND